jgi:hypothetical protein
LSPVEVQLAHTVQLGLAADGWPGWKEGWKEGKGMVSKKERAMIAMQEIQVLQQQQHCAKRIEMYN